MAIMKDDQLKVVALALVDLGEGADKVIHGGTTVAQKAAALMGFLVTKVADLSALSGLSAAELKSEFAALNNETVQDLVSYVKQELQLTDANVEAKIETGLDILVKLEGLGEDVMGFIKSMKPAVAAAAPAAAPSA